MAFPACHGSCIVIHLVPGQSEAGQAVIEMSQGRLIEVIIPPPVFTVAACALLNLIDLAVYAIVAGDLLSSLHAKTSPGR